MIYTFVPSAQSWLSGTGVRAKWAHHKTERFELNPQFLMHHSLIKHNGIGVHLRIGYRAIARSTDARSFIGAIIPPFPCGNAVLTLHLDRGSVDDLLCVAAFLNSFVFDWVLRQRLGATNLNWYILAEGALPRYVATSGLARIIKKLNCFPNSLGAVVPARAATTHNALQHAERIRLRAIVDAIAGAVYGCSSADLHHILRDCDLPTSEVDSRSGEFSWLDPRGFWRIERDVDPELRHTVLTLVAFRDLESKVEAAGGDRKAGIGACIRLPGAGLIFSSVNGRKWTEPPGKLLHDEVVPAQICRHRGVGLCGCEGVGNEGHEGRLAGRRTCAEHVAVESAHGRLAVPLSPRQLVSASSAATVGPGGSLAGRWVWRLPRRIPVPHGGARPRGSRRWRRRQ